MLANFIYTKCSSNKCLLPYLEKLSVHMQPWFIVRDFNCMIEDGERIGGKPCPMSDMEDFNKCIDMCSILELNVSSAK